MGEMFGGGLHRIQLHGAKMDFTLNKEQPDIKNAAREFALGEFPDRAVEFDREENFNLKIWRKACELGFVGGWRKLRVI